MPLFSFVAIPLSFNALNHIKWRDERGHTHNFHLVTRACDKWERTGMMLGYKIDELQRIKSDLGGKNELCWCSLMEKWLLRKVVSSYPASWEGLCRLMEESEISVTTLQLLRKAVARAVVSAVPEQLC